MRALAYFFVSVGLAALGWAAVDLMDTITSPASDLTQTSLPPQTMKTADEVPPARPFLAIYGTTPTSAPTETAPVQRNVPYTLKGVVAVGQNRWAILAREGGDLIVREGDQLGDGFAVARVHAEGVELMIDADTIALGFDTTAPVSVAQFQQDTTPRTSDTPKGNLQLDQPVGVLFQDMTGDEILAALEKAEEQRRERGWATDSN